MFNSYQHIYLNRHRRLRMRQDLLKYLLLHLYHLCNFRLVHYDLFL